MEYMHFMKDNKHKKVCQHSFGNELVRLALGVGKIIKGNGAIFFVDYKYIPCERYKYIKYGRIVVDYRPQK